jgi:hypothetical protein
MNKYYTNFNNHKITNMKNAIFALAIAATMLASCNSNGSETTNTTTDSTSVQVDTVKTTADSTSTDATNK